MELMGNVAVFCDAGYFLRAGGQAVAGGRVARDQVILDVPVAIAAMIEAASKVCSSRFLRIYWYDAVLSPGHKTAEHSSLAQSNGVKLRFGWLNSEGQQKGVDPLIVTDMIELARNRAIDDAVLIGGDGDLVVGVQIAQTMGVRVHLLGIQPSRGNQAPLLREEVDTLQEWGAEKLKEMLTIRPTLGPPSVAPLAEAVGSESTANPAQDSAEMRRAVDQFVDTLTKPEIPQIQDAIALNKGVIPFEYDRVLLSSCGKALGRELTSADKKVMRKQFRDRIDKL
jgi:uncharacterized LabA/DUF88 family protein